MLRQLASQLAAGNTASDTQCRDDQQCCPIEFQRLCLEHLEILPEPAEGFQCDDDETRRDGLVHGQSAEQHECRDDQEAAADADEPRDNADDQAVRANFPRSPRPAAGLLQIDWPEHEPGCDQHHDREQRELHHTGNVGGEHGAEVCARHARHTEHQDAAPLDESCADELESPGDGDAADNEKRAGDRHFFVLAHEVDEHRYRQDGAARTEQAETQADRDCAGHGQHHVHSRCAGSDRVERDFQVTDVVVFRLGQVAGTEIDL